MKDIITKESDENVPFNDVIVIIENARSRAFQAVNRELIDMYWSIGRYISEKTKTDNWGKAVVERLSQTIQTKYVGIKGFSPSNLWRMAQFYETYVENPKLATLLREISWSNNLLIMASAKTDETKEFYIRAAVQNKYSFRELERQLDAMIFERTMISNKKNRRAISKTPEISALRDSYVLEFLDIPETHSEKNLRKSIVANIKNFILEFGKDVAFIGEEYRVQVGNTDFLIDLLFYNRTLMCLIAIELKIGRFKPEHLGQLEFYLEALDRDVKKANENSSVGLILCASKDDAVVEYALSRSLSPSMVADYCLHLPD
ncbi:MAG: PDDEXK nuclease domain-containing protein [Holosporaceae bacterium]|nr:PDDEXK nuclease domain-containing protein [Holosporaceae bacterium]